MDIGGGHLVMLARVMDLPEQENGGHVYLGMREVYNKVVAPLTRQNFYAHVGKGGKEGDPH